MRKVLCIMLMACVLWSLAGCTQTAENNGNNAPTFVQTDPTDGAEPVKADFFQSEEELFTQRDSNAQYSGSQSVRIRLEGDSALSDSDSVIISGSTVTVTEEATYILSGTLNDGMLIVDAKDSAKIQLVLDGADITAKTSAAVYIRQADKVFITLAEGTENALANAGTFTAIDDSNIDAAVFSKPDLTFNGVGSLTVTSPAGHGIVCKDDLVFTGGSYTVHSASHGLDANDSVRITGTTCMNVDAGKDGIHCEHSEDASRGFVYIGNGTLELDAEGDGISAGAFLQIENGSFTLLTGGGSENGTKQSSGHFGGFMGGGKPAHRTTDNTADEKNAVTDESATSMKGLKSVSGTLINGGTFCINSADDAVHADGDVTINGGTFRIATGDDGIHAEETLTVTDGSIEITESYEGLEALHIHISGADIQLTAEDDGLNAAGGTDASGFTGGRDGMFGRPGGGRGGHGGMNGASNGSIRISGGRLYIQASGDGIDANGSLTISGGYTVVCGPAQGDTATLDYDTEAVITGGTFIGTGASGMAQSFSDSGQGVIALRVANMAAGTQILVMDADGKTILSHTPELSFGVVIFSDPALQKGQSYTVTVGNQTGEYKAT